MGLLETDEQFEFLAISTRRDGRVVDGGGLENPSRAFFRTRDFPCKVRTSRQIAHARRIVSRGVLLVPF